ncbi:MAG: MotA/TolQ/ExbB proton channel family protein [Defluviitaleaceae bacterium]|nr:MotA/TolQ/ExbB proton channel family protein [Defluviitaleaceae bacterium]
MGFISAIVNNFIGYDLVIVGFAVGNAIIYFLTKNELARMNELIHKTSDLSLGDSSEGHVVALGHNDLVAIKKARKRTNLCYSIFVNIISIFPLLGLLGTVISLIFTAGNVGLEATQQYFMMSLTSTFWGMIFAITYKIMDAFISPKIEMLNNDAERTIVKRDV